jgi:hypothetical protein
VARDWGDRPRPPAPLDHLFASLEVLRDTYRSFTLSRVGPRQWEARTYCGCTNRTRRRCSCSVGHGDSPREAIAALIDELA